MIHVSIIIEYQRATCGVGCVDLSSVVCGTCAVRVRYGYGTCKVHTCRVRVRSRTVRVVRYGTLRYAAGRCGAVRYGTVWYGMVRYGTRQRMICELYSNVPNIPVQIIITRLKFAYKLLFSGTGTTYTDIYQCLHAKNNNFSD